MKCKDCKWWEGQKRYKRGVGKVEPKVGQCFRMPHTEMKEIDSWCGEFKPKVCSHAYVVGNENCVICGEKKKPNDSD